MEERLPIKQRHEIYKKALVVLRESYSVKTWIKDIFISRYYIQYCPGLCYCIEDVQLYSRYKKHLNQRELPELYSHKPNNLVSVYWWSIGLYGYLRRVHTLKSAIKATKS